jgi:hypothetical protein
MNRIKTWWDDRRRRNNRKHWEIGFCWAAGQLLLKQETPHSIMTKCESSQVFFGKRDPFDEGALAALRILHHSDLVQ